MSLAARGEAAQRDFQSLQSELSEIIETRQKLGAQLAENESVNKEFALLTPNNTIYKLVGGALLKQDQAEAKNNVEKRLEYIKSEIKRVETKLKEVETKLEAKRTELVQIQTEAQTTPST